MVRLRAQGSALRLFVLQDGRRRRARAAPLLGGRAPARRRSPRRAGARRARRPRRWRRRDAACVRRAPPAGSSGRAGRAQPPRPPPPPHRRHQRGNGRGDRLDPRPHLRRLRPPPVRVRVAAPRLHRHQAPLPGLALVRLPPPLPARLHRRRPRALATRSLGAHAHHPLHRPLHGAHLRLHRRRPRPPRTLGASSLRRRTAGRVRGRFHGRVLPRRHRRRGGARSVERARRPGTGGGPPAAARPACVQPAPPPPQPQPRRRHRRDAAARSRRRPLPRALLRQRVALPSALALGRGWEAPTRRAQVAPR
mmetsp:Transcript_20380/g.63632  ORF Transcript_20380/g.63632 Transcript_20380/m.63632 type:complete len:308 (-) Transcript_20380:306-1229(-)